MTPTAIADETTARARHAKELEVAIRDELQERGLTFEVMRPRPDDAQAPWMDLLIGECWDVAKDGFGRFLPYEAINGRTREATLITAARAEDGRLVAYTVNDLLTLAGVPVNYWASGFDRRTLSDGKQLKGTGMYRLINPYRCAAIDAQVLMTRTQNPVVDHAFSKEAARLGLDLYPDENGECPLEVLEIGRAFNPAVLSSLICKGVYNFGEPCGPRALMYDTPLPRTERQRRIWANIDVAHGDATLLIAVPKGYVRAREQERAA